MTTVGFVGLGLIGSRRRSIAEGLGAEVVFVVEPDEGIREQLADAPFPVAPSLDALTERGVPAVDAVFVAVPHDVAAETCSWAFSRGAHVLCEKPMGLSIVEAASIRDAARGAGREFCAGFNYRYLPGIAKARELLGDGSIGEVFRVRMLMGHGGRPGMEREWKLSRARAGGGALIDPGIHLVDLAAHLFGTPEVVSARLERRFWDADVEDNCALALRCGGAEVSLDVTLTSWKNLFAIEIFGSEGTVQVQGRGGNYGTQVVELTNRWFWDGDDRRATWTLGGTDPSFHHETEAFLRLVATGERDGVLSGAEDGEQALSAVEAAYAAAGAPPPAPNPL